MPKLCLPEGPNKCDIPVALTESNEHKVPGVKGSILAISSNHREPDTHLLKYLVKDDDGAQIQASMLTIALKLLLRSGAFSSISDTVILAHAAD